MTETEEIVNIELSPQLCPWKLSKQIVAVGGNNKSYFRWVHPWQGFRYIENKHKYVSVEWFHVHLRHSYPAYLLSELLYYLPEGYVVGHMSGEWYCKDSTDSWSYVEYYNSAVKACAHIYIEILKRKIKEEEKSEEQH